MSKKIQVTYMGGESRENNRSCDYFIAEVKDQDGDIVELYAEQEYPEDAPAEDEVVRSVWEKYEKAVYKELYEKFMIKAKELGYSESDFEIDGGYDLSGDEEA